MKKEAKIREGATLKIHPETRDRLKDAGKKGETYDEIINRLLNCRLKTKNMEVEK